MNVLFEEDGVFRAGTVLADNTTSLQVDTSTGRRAKVKAASVVLRFADPAPAVLLERAEAQAETIDIDFLWEVCGEEEFGFLELAREYYGHEPSAVEAAAALLRLHSAPIYFHRKGKGRFRKAPADILKAALAGLEKKRQQAAAIERMARELGEGRLPEEFRPVLPQLLYRPDRNRIETKALELACDQQGVAAPRLLERCGAIRSLHEYHFGRFLFEHFPRGTGFGECAPAVLPDELPVAEVAAFSIDDVTTTEIDDAFSLTALEEGGWRVGIHIAAPGLGFGPGSALDALARARLSTVYMPGTKITMLPEDVVERFTLNAGRACPAVSLYLEIGPDYATRRSFSRIERVPVTHNLRHHDIEPLFSEERLAAGSVPEFPFREPLTRLWELACVLEAGRGKPAANRLMKDYSFYVDWSVPEGRIEIVERPRGSPLDKLVAELMIVANSAWGRVLADAGIPAIYRAQTGGKVRMTTVAAPHEGLGVDCYAWSSSPLRRYVDLINQWQLLAHLSGEAAPFGPRSEALLSAMRDFELTYAAYADFQRQMERYWCLRWLAQEGLSSPAAVVLRESLVRLESAPLVLRVPSLPALAPGSRVRLAIDAIDYLELEARSHFVEPLPAAAAAGEQAGGEGFSPESEPE